MTLKKPSGQSYRNTPFSNCKPTFGLLSIDGNGESKLGGLRNYVDNTQTRH